MTGLWPGTGRFGGARPNPRCWGPRLPRPCHFPAIRSSYSGLFNGLRAIQIKKRCSPFSLLLLRSPPRPAGRKRRERNDFDRADTRPSPPGRRPENKYRTTVALSRNSRSFCRRGSTPLPLQLCGGGLAPRFKSDGPVTMIEPSNRATRLGLCPACSRRRRDQRGHRDFRQAFPAADHCVSRRLPRSFR